ncbi:MAG: hypothetical protein MI725_03545 [Pirellulales bacterium]|nr:hypothetical protein [Pirellulales bacterium]
MFEQARHYFVLETTNGWVVCSAVRSMQRFAKDIRFDASDKHQLCRWLAPWLWGWRYLSRLITGNSPQAKFRDSRSDRNG